MAGELGSVPTTAAHFERRLASMYNVYLSSNNKREHEILSSVMMT